MRLNGLAMLALACCGMAHADPAIWQVKGQHNTLYLLGTIHMLPADEPLADNISKVYGESERLLMELDMDDLDPLALQGLMMQSGLLPDGQDLNAQLDAGMQRKLQAAARDVGFDSALLARFQPWLAALVLEQLQYAKQGLSAESGLEMRLTQLAGTDRKPIDGLETLQDQLSLFTRMDAAAQREFLQQTLDEMQESPNEVQQLLKAWRAGDQQHLQALLQQGLRDSPELMEQLTVRRNQRWVRVLRPLLDRQRDDYLVAVGALHLVGEQGLVNLLKQAGYSVTRH